MIKEAHNQEVAGSNLAPATRETHLIDGFFVYRHLGLVGCIFCRLKYEKLV